MRQCGSPRRVLEVGPGTGAVTAEIVRLLRPGDQLDIVEINADFVAYLGQRFESEPAFRRKREQCRIMHQPLQEVPGEYAYDFMISGLPLNIFPLPLVQDIYRSYDLGVNSYIVKPVTFEALVDILQTLEKYWFEIVELPPEKK